MTQYSDFVKDYAMKKKLSWNCAVCEIKTNGLYKPAPKTRTEPKKKNSANKTASEFKKKIKVNKTYQKLNQRAKEDAKSQVEYLERMKEKEDIILDKDPKLKKLYEKDFLFFYEKSRDEKFNELKKELLSVCGKTPVIRNGVVQTNYECGDLELEIDNLFEKDLKRFIDVSYRTILARENAKKAKAPKPAPKRKKQEEIDEDPDIISSQLQQLLLLKGTNNIVKALINLNFKGRLQTNPMLRNLQILQNFNTTKKMKELINELNKV